MASTHGTPQGDFDERLADALASVLTIGEEPIAREEGDQGQAIVLTDSRIILLRAGLAATGELNGHKVSSFPLKSISAINLRKGPLGAVIQIVAEDSESASDGARPDNVIVFTGPGRVKKAEAFAATIESKAGKAVARTEPQLRPDDQAAGTEPMPDMPKVHRARKSLAEQIYSEAVQTHSDDSTEQTIEAVQAEAPAAPEPEVSVELAVDEEEPEENTLHRAFNPNPRLPQPKRKREHGPNRLLVAMGVLAALVFVGMAVTAPLHEASDSPVVGQISSTASNDSRRVRLQLVAVSAYRTEVTRAIAKASSAEAEFRSAVRSGNSSSIMAASRSDAADRACQKLIDLSVPPGLAEAKQDLIDGVVAMKNAVAAAAASAGASGSVDARDTLDRLDRADARIKRGLAAISSASASLQQQATKRTPAAHSAKAAH